MFTNDLNLNNLRVFEAVYRTGSMTTAAQELHLTQSGVSQHMKALEDVIGVRLFDRIKQRIVPTTAGKALYDRSSQALHGIEDVLREIKLQTGKLSGMVHIGMPIEFGNNMIMPALSEFCKKNSNVKFKISYGFATGMYERLLQGELDYAFVDAFAQDRRIIAEKMYDETLHLCASPTLFKRVGLSTQKEDVRLFETLEYVDYQPGEPVLRMWFNHHLAGKTPRLNVRATVMDVQGVARLILSGLAAGVLPSHLLQKLKSDDVKLHRFKGKNVDLTNTISVAYLRERTQTPAAAAALDWLKSSLKNVARK